MAVAVTVDVPGRTEQQCQQIAAKIVRDGILPEGWLDAPGRPGRERVASSQRGALAAGVRELRPRAAPARAEAAAYAAPAPGVVVRAGGVEPIQGSQAKHPYPNESGVAESRTRSPPP